MENRRKRCYLEAPSGQRRTPEFTYDQLMIALTGYARYPRLDQIKESRDSRADCGILMGNISPTGFFLEGDGVEV